MFSKKIEHFRGEEVTVVDGLGHMSLSDTLECGQAFRYEVLTREENYIEYLTVAYGKIIIVGQRKPGELIFFGSWDEEYEEAVRRYFALETDFEMIRQDVLSRTDSE